MGFKPGEPLPMIDAMKSIIAAALPSRNDRPKTIQEEFEAHIGEIRDLITDKDEPLKPKSAFLAVKQKHDLAGSYESFKIFARQHRLAKSTIEPTIRIETRPGEETQIDYGQVGFHIDPLTGKRRKVYAFCAKLSYSRLPFVMFVYTQDQESWVESHIQMGEYFGGFTEYFTIDNLKAGIIKPDKYDPRLNPAYQEFAEYVGVFINPCVIRHSKGKGKVERLVPDMRELYRRLHHLYPTKSLPELSLLGQQSCKEEYGRKPHGTTRIAPMKAFEEVERATLKPLPSVRFEIPTWKKPIVHRDQFFTFSGKRFAMPVGWRDKPVLARKSGSILRVFDLRYNLLREYVLDGKMVQWLPGDFPESSEAMMKGDYPRFLIDRAAAFGPSSRKLVEAILAPHAYLNARRARGTIAVLEKHRDAPFLQELCQTALRKRMFVPAQLKALLEVEAKQRHFEFIVPQSELGKAMVRDVSEYFN
jgi:hypothetical protein